MYGGRPAAGAMAAQVFYPEIQWRVHRVSDRSIFAPTGRDIYRHKNAYYIDDSWKKTPRPGKRNYLGELAATIEDMNHMELALGTKSRSGGQFDIWEAVYSPVGADGYPKPIWNKLTGRLIAQ